MCGLFTVCELTFVEREGFSSFSHCCLLELFALIFVCVEQFYFFLSFS